MGIAGDVLSLENSANVLRYLALWIVTVDALEYIHKPGYQHLFYRQETQSPSASQAL